ncbi:MAG TPA: ERCC4 domain-containing protein [Candidatus Bilamarchaeaceae archaeon]|nr:ERCC4 domain-containing protein [Candidatus Bilamarchaeaceae archaeon]
MQQFLDVGPPDVVKIFVDTREDPEFDNVLKSLGAYVIRKQLEVGDFICSDRVIVERKTRSDFESSIIDGRLFKQLDNLIENYSRVVVIIEGTSEMERLNKNAILGAYSSIIANYGASLFFTKSSEKTMELIYNLAKYEQFSEKRVARLFARRKGNTLSQNQQIIVESFPMVGPKLAKNLLTHFGSLENLFKASERELLEVDGMGKKKAKLVKTILASSFEG